jgi:hypothetical protein
MLFDKITSLLQNHTFMLEEKLTWYVNVFYVMYIFLRPPFLHKTYGWNPEEGWHGKLCQVRLKFFPRPLSPTKHVFDNAKTVDMVSWNWLNSCPAHPYETIL